MDNNILEAGLSLLSTIATGIIGYLVYRLKRNEERKEAEERRRHEIEVQRLNQQKEEANAFKASLLALTRDRILQGYRYYRKQGYVSTQDLETMSKLYDAYHKLGGNGTITAVYHKIENLSVEEE